MKTIWPSFNLCEALLRAIDELCDRTHRDFLHSMGRQLLWPPETLPGGPKMTVKLDVVNVPLLTGFLVQSCDASQWLQTGDHMPALRRIKAFDPLWFETGLQAGALLALKAIQPPTGARRAK